MLVRHLDCTEKVPFASIQPFGAAQGQFASDPEQLGDKKLAFVMEVDFRALEGGDGLPSVAKNRQTSCKLCLQDRMENTVARRRQLLQSGIKQIGSRLGRSLPNPAKRLHGNSEAVIAIHGVFSGVLYKLVGKRIGFAVLGICQIRIEGRPGERNAERHCLIELASLGDRHPAKPLRLIG